MHPGHIFVFLSMAVMTSHFIIVAERSPEVLTYSFGYELGLLKTMGLTVK